MGTDPFDSIRRPRKGGSIEIGQPTFVDLTIASICVTTPAIGKKSPNVAQSVNRLAFGKGCTPTKESTAPIPVVTSALPFNTYKYDISANAELNNALVVRALDLVQRQSTIEENIIAQIVNNNSINFNGQANWNGSAIGNLTTVGSNGGPSYYGTYDQDGNVSEWCDTDPVPQPPPPTPPPPPSGLPKILIQPKNLTVQVGGTATFSVTASDAIGYQWQGGRDPSGADFRLLANPGQNANTLLLERVTIDLNGLIIRVVVAGTQGEIISDYVTLTVTPVQPPVPPSPTPSDATITISLQPSDQTAVNGTANFTTVAAVSPSGTPTYQWQRRKYVTPGSGWTSVNAPSQDLFDIAYGNGKFIAVPRGFLSSEDRRQTAYVSTDGITWIEQALPSLAYWQSITFGNGRFVTIASGGGNWDDPGPKVAVSTDGVNWTLGDLPKGLGWIDVTYGDGRFVAIRQFAAAEPTYLGGPFVNSPFNAAYSNDGLTWTPSVLPWGEIGWRSVAYGQGKFVAIPYTGLFSFTSNAAISTDGQTWVGINLPIASDWISVAYGNGRFVAVAYGIAVAGEDRGSVGHVVTSTDGINWTLLNVPNNNTGVWTNISYGGGIWLLLGSGGLAKTSVDGINWDSQIIPINNGTSAIYGDGLYVAIGTGPSNNLAISGSLWQDVPGQTSSTLSLSDISITQNGDQYRAVVRYANATAVTQPATLFVKQPQPTPPPPPPPPPPPAPPAPPPETSSFILSYTPSVLVDRADGQTASLEVILLPSAPTTYYRWHVRRAGGSEAEWIPCDYIGPGSRGSTGGNGWPLPHTNRLTVGYWIRDILLGNNYPSLWSAASNTIQLVENLDGAEFMAQLSTTPNLSGVYATTPVMKVFLQSITTPPPQPPTTTVPSNRPLFGWGNIGRRVNGDIINRPDPELIGADEWKQVAAGDPIAVGIKADGTLWEINYQTLDVKDASTDWIMVANGQSHYLALKSDGTLWSWGDNRFGQLGIGSPSSSVINLTKITNQKWKHISAGQFYSLAIREDDTLWAWGHNGFGQLGDETYIDRYVPTQIALTGSYVGTEKWKTASAGIGGAFEPGRWSLEGYQSHTVAIRDDGTLWAWGANILGQLGQRSGATGGVVARNSPTLVSSRSWRQVSSGYDHTLAIQADGTLWSCGGNSYGQLGYGFTNISNNRLERVGQDTGWIDVSAGNGFSIAVRERGWPNPSDRNSLWSWGLDYRYIGVGNVSTPRSWGVNDVSSISAGVAQTYFITQAAQTLAYKYGQSDPIATQLVREVDDDSWKVKSLIRTQAAGPTIMRTAMGANLNTNLQSSSKYSISLDASVGYYNVGFRIASKINQTDMVVINDEGNEPDTTGLGKVDAQYYIGIYPITNCEYTYFLNSVARTDAYDLYDNRMSRPAGSPNYGGITRTGVDGEYAYSFVDDMANKPVVYVSWYSCIRYCNWLQNGRPTGEQGPSTTESGAYTINGDIVTYNDTAQYRLPTHNQWYKAAYYRGQSNVGYWSYATQSNDAPQAVTASPIGDGLLNGQTANKTKFECIQPSGSGELRLPLLRLSGRGIVHIPCYPSVVIENVVDGQAVNEKQSIVLPIATQGQWQLSWRYQGKTQSVSIPYGATAAVVRNKFGSMPITGGRKNLLVTGSGTKQDPYIVEFINDLGANDHRLITIDVSGLSGTSDSYISKIVDGTRNEQKTITNKNQSTRNFTVTFSGVTSQSIAYNASLNRMTSVLEGMSSIGTGNVRVEGEISDRDAPYRGPYRVIFIGDYGNQSVGEMTINPSQDYEIKTDWNGGSGGGTNEQQLININAKGGTYRIILTSPDTVPQTGTTATIPFNASVTSIRSAIVNSIGWIDAQDIIVTSSTRDETNGIYKYRLEFTGKFARRNMPLAQIDNTGLTGNSATVQVIQEGTGVREQQMLIVSRANAGTYLLRIKIAGTWYQTQPIQWDETPAALSQKIGQLPPLSTGDVTVTNSPRTESEQNYRYLISFRRKFGNIEKIEPIYRDTLKCDPLALPKVLEPPYDYPLPECQDNNYDYGDQPSICEPGAGDVLPVTEPCCNDQNIDDNINIATRIKLERDILDPGADQTIKQLAAAKGLPVSNYVPYVRYGGNIVETTYDVKIQSKMQVLLVHLDLNNTNDLQRIIKQIDAGIVLPNRFVWPDCQSEQCW